MSNVDELCVKYVFDELDPSEVTFVEKAMLDDENLLIEVESLKSTWRKLKKLPELEPPDNISQAIIEQAREHSNQQQLFNSSWSNPGLMATAAIVVFSLMVSTAYLLPGDNESETKTPGNSPVAGSGTGIAVTPIEFSEKMEQFQPWSERQNYIFTGKKEDDDQEQQSDSLERRGLRQTGQGITPVIISGDQQSFQLTGTNY